METNTITRDDILISDDKKLLDIPYIHQFLHHHSYWAQYIPLDVVERCIKGSYCFGVYKNNTQIGFARVVSDGATFGYLADVFIDPQYRGLGLSKKLMNCIMSHPELQGFRNWMLGTKDAHGLYAQFGFAPLPAPERYMSKPDPDIYKRSNH